MKIYDVSLTVSEDIVVWEGDRQPEFKKAVTHGQQGRVQVTEIKFGVHTGTHIDAPLHFIEGGSGIDSIDTETLLGLCMVIEVGDENGLIHEHHLLSAGFTSNTERLLLKTRNSHENLLGRKSFSTDYVSLSLNAGEFLIRSGVKLVGIDYLSIAPFDDVYPVHQALLGEGIVVVEGVDLRAIDPGTYTLAALPVKLRDSDGAPARVLLIADEIN